LCRFSGTAGKLERVDASVTWAPQPDLKNAPPDAGRMLDACERQAATSPRSDGPRSKMITVDENWDTREYRFAILITIALNEDARHRIFFA
jgi:hypothetical protein